MYITIMNIVSFLLFGIDKTRAVHGGRRVPEKRLFTVAALGGAAGGWLAMRLFRHKTKHASFRFGIPALLAANALCAFWLSGILSN